MQAIKANREHKNEVIKNQKTGKEEGKERKDRGKGKEEKEEKGEKREREKGEKREKKGRRRGGVQKDKATNERYTLSRHEALTM